MFGNKSQKLNRLADIIESDIDTFESNHCHARIIDIKDEHMERFFELTEMLQEEFDGNPMLFDLPPIGYIDEYPVSLFEDDFLELVDPWKSSYESTGVIFIGAGAVQEKHLECFNQLTIFAERNQNELEIHSEKIESLKQISSQIEKNEFKLGINSDYNIHSDNISVLVHPDFVPFSEVQSNLPYGRFESLRDWILEFQ